MHVASRLVAPAARGAWLRQLPAAPSAAQWLRGQRSAAGAAGAASGSRKPQAAAGRPAGPGHPGGGAGEAPAATGPPKILGVTGLPVSSAKSGGPAAAGPVIELSAKNFQQILQNPGALLLQVGKPPDAVNKKLDRLRLSAAGRLPLVMLDCQAMPQVCQALQIASEPTILLMAKGQVVAALENNLSPQATTAFVEQVSKMLGIKLDLAEDVSEQLLALEDLEWTSPADAERDFVNLSQAADLPNDARIRAAAGRARCTLRQPGRLAEARAYLDVLQSNGHGSVPEVKQLAALVWLADNSADAPLPLAQLQQAAAAAPKDFQPHLAYSTALFWDGQLKEAVDAAMGLLRRAPRSEEFRKLAQSLIEALGPRHPLSARARKSFSNALFI